MTGSRLTVIRPEVARNTGATSKLTSIRPEVGLNANPVSKLTSIRPEVAWAANPRSRLTAILPEVGVPYAAPVVLPAGGSAQLWPRGGGALPGVIPPVSVLVGDAAGGDLSGTYPNPSVAKLKGVAMSGTLGNGQVWQYNSSSGLLVPATPGAPTTKYVIHDPFLPDVSPHALNEEFDTTSLAAFSTIYTGDAGVTVDANTTVPGWLFIEAPNVNYRYRALAKALPGDANWTIHTVMQIITGSHSDGFWGGLFLSNSATPGSGNQHGAIANLTASDGVARKGRVFWDGWGNTASGANGAQFGSWQGPYIFLRWRKQAGTYYHAWSNDGLNWYEGSTTLYASMTPTHFAIAGQNYTGQAVTRVAFGYLRYYANGTQYLTGGLRNVI